MAIVFISITEISVEQDKEVQVFEDKICGVFIFIRIHPTN